MKFFCAEAARIKASVTTLADKARVAQQVIETQVIFDWILIGLYYTHVHY